MKQLFIMALAIILCQLMQAQTMGTYTDTRDGKTYKTVSYEVELYGLKTNMTWMAENLNYKTENSSCYDDISALCSKHGRLYTREDAISVCPEGWHLPSGSEFKMLVNQYANQEEAAKALKSKEVWPEDNHANNSSGFNALASGHWDGKVKKYRSIGSLTYFWSATYIEKSYGENIEPSLLPDNLTLYNKPYGGGSIISKNYTFYKGKVSVRCLKD